MNTDAVTTGDVILHYRIQGRLGAGGMGVVFKALDTRLQRPVALKFLPPDLAGGIHRERLLREAMAASAIEHPNIGIVHAVEEAPDQRLFIVMSCYEGGTLKHRLDRGPVSQSEAVEIALQTARGLFEAHTKGIIHRDIKPSNLIVTPNGVVKIVDFGLAKILGGSDLTDTGTTMGTAAYMSPEQATGGTVDHRTDIWSLGVVLYEMLQGATPFNGESHAALLYAVVHSEPLPPSRVCAPLQAILRKCMARPSQKRYQSLAPLIHELEAFQALSPTVKRSDDSTETLSSAKAAPSLLSRFMPWPAALVAAILLAVAGSLWIPWRKPVPLPKAATPPATAPALHPQGSAAALPPPGEAPHPTASSSPPVVISKRAPEVPPKSPPAPRSKPETPVYAGPKEGRIVWTGELEAGQELDLTAKGAAIGSLPGVPVSVEVHPSSLQVITPPSAANQWRRLVVRNVGGRQVFITVNWALISP